MIERQPTDWRAPAMQRRLQRRYAAERRFRLLGLAATLWVMAVARSRGPLGVDP